MAEDPKPGISEEHPEQPQPRDESYSDNASDSEESLAAELEVFESLPEEAKNDLARHLARRIVRLKRHYSYKGPTPPPEMLQGYENVLPGSAQEIMDRGRRQPDHRMNMERSAMEASIVNSKRGQNYALILALAVIGVGAIAVLMGNGAVALAIILPGLVGLVSVFLYSQRIQQMHLSEGREAFRQESRGNPE